MKELICPLCGGTVTLEKRNGNYKFYHKERCASSDCFMATLNGEPLGRYMYYTEEEAMKDWNACTKSLVRADDEDFGTILNCAVRYSIGRQTYMPKLVMDFIKPLLPHLTDRTIYCLEKDITGYYSDYSDKTIVDPDWTRFLYAVRCEREKRKQNKED